MEDRKLRHELKYKISYSDYLAIRTRLAAVAKLDIHAGKSGSYQIRSLYFDNYKDKALREKLDGVDVREKFRIRYYNLDSSRITLEKKEKIHGMCRKKQAAITKEQCQSLLNGIEIPLSEECSPLLRELQEKMKHQCIRPRVIVDYTREPYVYEQGNVRITLDYDIRTGLFCRDFLIRKFPPYPQERRKSYWK